MPSVKCPCGCGQAPAETTRLRKASCSCGASIIRLSRAALATVDATCIACGGDISPDCTLDRTHLAGPDAATACAELEAAYDRGLVRNLITMPGKPGSRYRCGDCQAIRAAHGPCKKCGSERPPTTSYMHPRAARAAGGDMPF